MGRHINDAKLRIALSYGKTKYKMCKAGLKQLHTCRQQKKKRNKHTAVLQQPSVAHLMYIACVAADVKFFVYLLKNRVNV